MDEIKSVKIELFQNGIPFKTMENLTQSEYQNYFMRGRSYLDSSENTEEDEELADTIRILFISSKNQLAKSIKDSIDSRAIFIPYINDGSYLNKIPYYYQNNLVTLGRNTDFGQSFKVECTLTYQNSCRPNVKIIKEVK